MPHFEDKTLCYVLYQNILYSIFVQIYVSAYIKRIIRKNFTNFYAGEGLHFSQRQQKVVE